MSSKLVTFCIAFYIDLSDDRELLCGPGLLLSTLPFIKTKLLLSIACTMPNLAEPPLLKFLSRCYYIFLVNECIFPQNLPGGGLSIFKGIWYILREKYHVLFKNISNKC